MLTAKCWQCISIALRMATEGFSVLLTRIRPCITGPSVSGSVRRGSTEHVWFHTESTSGRLGGGCSGPKQSTPTHVRQGGLLWVVANPKGCTPPGNGGEPLHSFNGTTQRGRGTRGAKDAERRNKVSKGMWFRRDFATHCSKHLQVRGDAEASLLPRNGVTIRRTLHPLLRLADLSEQLSPACNPKSHIGWYRKANFAHDRCHSPHRYLRCLRSNGTEQRWVPVHLSGSPGMST